MKKVLIVCLLCFLPWSASQAEIKGFFGTGAGLINWYNDDSDFSAKPTNVYFRGGVALNSFIDLGVEWSTSLLDDKNDSLDLEVDSTLIFAKLNVPIGDSIQLYGLAGASNITLVATREDDSRLGSFDESGTAVGFGAQFGKAEGSKFSVEYLRYYQDDDEFDSIEGNITVESINIGYIAYF